MRTKHNTNFSGARNVKHMTNSKRGPVRAGTIRRLAVLSLCLLAAARSALAVDPVPDIKALIHLAVPRDGRRPATSNELDGVIRTQFETEIETYWKEISYFESDPATGERTHGFYLDTKTLGYVDLPWPCYPVISNYVSPLTWQNIHDKDVLPKEGRTVDFGGEHNWETGNPNTGKDGQLYGGSGPLIDGVWTPGERFFDTNGDGKYTPATDVSVEGEDWWDSDNTNALPRNWPGPPEIALYHGGGGAPPDTRGELYADYDGGTVVSVVDGALRVTRVDFDPSVIIYIADGQSNAAVSLTELDLTPNNNLSAPSQPSEEGDFFHLHYIDPATGGARANIPRNQQFDYQVDQFGSPLVFPARSGTDPNATLSLSYRRWMIIDTNGAEAVYGGGEAELDGAVQVDVTVPVYQSYELWGTRDGNVFVGSEGTWQAGSVTNVPGEPFEDFISWWLPHAGTNQAGLWLGGVTGGPIQEVNMPFRSLYNQISWAAYTNYIANNYPGNVALLTSRAGNNSYDGPDNWMETVNNKMQMQEYLNAGQTTTPEPGAFWDPRRWYGGAWTSWWSATFGTIAPPWEARISVCKPFVAAARTAGDWIPPVNSTWGYDGPQEFQDLASSLYHYGNGRDGDLRLGEMTSPYGRDIHGEDLGDNNPRTAVQVPDGQIAAGGPLAYAGVGQFGYDARNVQNFELLTWRTDGKSLTGPTNPVESIGAGYDVIGYGGDHRDRTLDGLVDQGETVPANSHCYYVDDWDVSMNGGFTAPPTPCLYPFNWERYAEDCLAVNDLVENYVQASAYGIEPIDEPLEPTPQFGAAGLLISNALGRATYVPHMQYARYDAAWVDEVRDGRFNMDPALIGSPRFGQPGTVLTNAYFQDLDANEVFDAAIDNAWVDTLVTNGIFDAEIVIRGGEFLPSGTLGSPYAEVFPGQQIVAAPSGGPNFQLGDPIWIENLNATSSNAVPMEYDLSDRPVMLWTNLLVGTPATLVITNALYFRGSIWLDANSNAQFDADERLVQHTPLVDFFGGPALYPGTVGLALTNVILRFSDQAPPGYQQTNDVVWIDKYGHSFYYFEPVLAGGGLYDGAPSSFAVTNARYVDSNGSLGYTRATSNAPGEAAWVDMTPDGIFSANRSRHLPIYFVGLHNDVPIGVDLAGNGFSSLTMDTDYPVGGFIQVVPTTLGPLHHEMGHDMFGWPDLYDYDRYLPDGYMNSPIAKFDLMAEGTLVHGTPDLKGSWIEPVDLAQLLPRGGGVQSVYMYPCERNRDQYYYFMNPDKPGEYFWFWYQSGVAANPFRNFAGVGMQGLHIQHNDVAGTVDGFPLQQRHNNHFTLEMVQADGRYELQDGVNGGGADDVWPGTTSNRLFTADTIPAARWWDQTDMGLRIHDVILPEDPLGPVEVRMEYFDPTLPWVWPADGADLDADGIPDLWEYHYFGGVNTAGPGTDWDLDGLSDLGEYLADTDPVAPGSNDGPEDKDGDGISNADEVNLYGSDPRLPDTDDDGLPDAAELRWQLAYGANPTNSLLPARSYSMRMGGTSNDFLALPDDLGFTRFALANGWTLEARLAGATAWSNATSILRYRVLGALTNAVRGSVLVERRVGVGQETFVLGVDTAGRPVAGFGNSDASWATALTNLPTDGGTWVSLAATYDPAGQILRLYVNGAERVNLPTGGRTPAVTGPGPIIQRLGTGFNGLLDDVRIWDRALSGAEILANRTTPPAGGELNLVAMYRFDDNTSFTFSGRGTSDVEGWDRGQVEDFNVAYIRNWHGGWRQGATMYGNTAFVPTNAGVVNVTSTNANGAYGTGQAVDLLVRFTGNVTVLGGSPQLQLDVGQPGSVGIATYVSGTGTDTLRFRYVVQSGDWSIDLDYASPSALVANGATLRDALSRNYNLQLPLPSGVGSLSWNKDIQLYEQQFVNGMSIDWLTANFPGQDPGTIDPNGDPDRDGMTTYDEYLAGTDPNDRNSLLRMRSLTPSSNNTFIVNWQATPGKFYTLKYTGRLNQTWTNPPAWQGLEAASDTMSIIDGTGQTPWPATQRFYRVTLEP